MSHTGYEKNGPQNHGTAEPDKLPLSDEVQVNYNAADPSKGSIHRDGCFSGVTEPATLRDALSDGKAFCGKCWDLLHGVPRAYLDPPECVCGSNAGYIWEDDRPDRCQCCRQAVPPNLEERIWREVIETRHALRSHRPPGEVQSSR